MNFRTSLSSSSTCRWFTRRRVSATARSSTLKLSQRFRLAHHTAISSSIRAGILCAVISASTRSLPQPKLPADSLPRRSLAKAGSSPTKEIVLLLRRSMTVAQTEIETAAVPWAPLPPTQRFGVAGRADAKCGYKCDLVVSCAQADRASIAPPTANRERN